MVINELDVVVLKNGQEATVLEVFTKPNRAYMLEFDNSCETDDFPIVAEDEIEKVIYKAKQ